MEQKKNKLLSDMIQNDTDKKMVQLVEAATDLSCGDICTLLEVAHSLPFVGNLEGGDTYINVLTREKESMVIAQYRHPNYDLYKRSIIGEIERREDEPAVYRALEEGISGRGLIGIIDEGRTVVRHTVSPILNSEKKVIGALTYEYPNAGADTESIRIINNQEGKQDPFNRQLGKASDYLQDAILLYDANGICTFVNPKAEVLYHYDEHGKKLEPMERAYIDVDDEYAGNVIQKLGERKGELINMHSNGSGSTRLEFEIPARGLIGFRGLFMTSTKGTGILNTEFEDYAPYKGDIEYRKQGSLIAFEAGETVTYGLFSAQERGTLFVGPGEKVYSGMVIGQNGKAEDIELNVCKTKHLTNTRSSSADDALKLVPPKVLSLEQAIEFIDQDELLEVTPKSLRIRKRILDSRDRKRAAFRKS